MKLLSLLHINEFEISAPHYCPAGNGDMLDVFVHNTVRLSKVIVSDILDSDHLPVTFYLLDYVTTRDLSDPVEEVTD
jgi:hypothetical protein